MIIIINEVNPALTFHNMTMVVVKKPLHLNHLESFAITREHEEPLSDTVDQSDKYI